MIAHGEVEIAITVHIAPGHTCGQIILGGRPDRARRQHPAVVAIDPVRLPGAVRTTNPTIANRKIKVAVAVYIAPGHTRGIVTLGGRPDRTRGQHATIVAVDPVRLPGAVRTTIAHGEVEVAVAVHVAPGHTGGVVAFGRGPNGANGQHATVVAVDPVWLTGAIHIPIANRKIKVAVTIHITPGHAGRRIIKLRRGPCRARGEHPTVVAIHPVRLARAVRADGEVKVTVAVYVTPRHTGGQITIGGRPDRARRQHPAIIAIEPVRRSIGVPDSEVKITVAVYIAPGHTGGPVALGGRPDWDCV